MKTLNFFKPAILAAALMVPAFAGANQELAQSKNCLACHQVEAKVVGPSFKDVAAKYKGDAAAADMLAEKIKAGGVGNWGQIPMPPNPGVSDEEAKTLVDWIMSL